MSSQMSLQAEKDGQGQGGSLLITWTMGPFGKAGRESPGHYHSLEKEALASYTQLFPAPSLVPLALLLRGVGPGQGPSSP